jgi:hypothetical protein
MEVDSGTVKLVSLSSCSSGEDDGGDDGVRTLGREGGGECFFLCPRVWLVKSFYSSVVDVVLGGGDDTNAICSE